MPVRKRNLKRRGNLTADEIAWLNGERNCGWVQFWHWDELEALWEAHGDKQAFEWKRGIYHPIARTAGRSLNVPD